MSFLKGVGFGRVDAEQLKAIADERIVTAFEIAQMLIEYLLYTEQKFKRKCNDYKERLRRKDGEFRELKRQFDNQNVEVQQYKLRINKNKEIVATFESLLRQTPPVITGRAWSCSICHKAFIMKEYLNKHIETYHNGEAESEEVESKADVGPKKKIVKKVVKKGVKKVAKKAAVKVQQQQQQPEEVQEEPEPEVEVQEEEPEPVESVQPEPTKTAVAPAKKQSPVAKKQPAAKKPSPKKASPKRSPKKAPEAPEMENELDEEPTLDEEEIAPEEEEGDENKPSINEENVPERENEVVGDENIKPEEEGENGPNETGNNEAKPENENVTAPEEVVPVEEKPEEVVPVEEKPEEVPQDGLVKAETKLPKKPYVPPTEEERKTFGVARTLTSTLPRQGTKLTTGLPFDVVAEIPSEFRESYNAYTVYIDTTTPICDAISDIFIALQIKSTPQSHPKYYSLFAKETNGNITPLKALSAAKDTVLYTGDVDHLILKYTPEVDVMKEEGNDLKYVQNYIDSILCYDQDVVKLEQDAAVDSDIDEDVLDDSLKPQDVNDKPSQQQSEVRRSTKQTILRPKTAKPKKSLRPLTGEPMRANTDSVKIPTYQDPVVKEDIRKSLAATLQNLNLDNLSVGSLEDDVMNPDNYLDVDDNENLDSVVDSELDSVYA